MATVQEVIEEGLDRADMLNSKFIDATRQLSYFNKGYAAMYGIVTSIYEKEFMSTVPYEFTISSRTLFTDLPADFYKLKGIDQFQGGGAPSTVDEGNWIEVRKFNFLNRNRKNILRPIRGIYPAVRYALAGENPPKIMWDDPQNSLGSYRVWYIPNPPVQTDTDTEVFFANQYRQDYVALEIARRCLIKEESDTIAVEREMAEMADNISSFDRDRDAGEPETVTDVEVDANRYGFYGGFDVY